MDRSTNRRGKVANRMAVYKLLNSALLRAICVCIFQVCLTYLPLLPNSPLLILPIAAHLTAAITINPFLQGPMIADSVFSSVNGRSCEEGDFRISQPGQDCSMRSACEEAAYLLPTVGDSQPIGEGVVLGRLVIFPSKRSRK